MPTDKPRISIVLEEDILLAVEHYRYLNGFRSTSRAVLDLIQKGLAKDVPGLPLGSIFNGDELRLISLFRKSNNTDRAVIMNTALKARFREMKPIVRHPVPDAEDDFFNTIDILDINCFTALYSRMSLEDRNNFLMKLIEGRENLLDHDLLNQLDSRLGTDYAAFAAERSEPLGSEDDTAGN